MHLLLSNDDGIFAPGIRVLAEVLRGAGHRVTVCAPDRERSAASHSVTLAGTLHAEPRALDWADRAWAVDGTPADCASLGLFLASRHAPVDMVVAGINRGMNLGGACVYSGTVASALEAAMCGTQALAVSLCVNPEAGDAEDYTAAARLALRVVDWMPAHPLPLGAMYNLNVPPRPYEQILGLVPATLAPVFLDEPNYTPTEDGGYRYRGTPRPFEGADYDLVRIRQGYATLTKLTWDFRLNAADGELAGIGLE